MIGERLIHIRSGYSQAEFATLLGVHKNTYARWERDERDPSAPELLSLVKLGWNANWILTGEGPERLDAVATASQTARPDNLMMALTLVAEALGPMKATPAVHAELTVLVMEMLDEGLSEAKVLQFARRAKNITGDSNEGGSGAGGEGTAVAG